MKTYNGITIPPLIRTDRIISAFENGIEEDKLEEYTAIMKREMMSHEFPPIEGFPRILDEEDIGLCFMTGEEVTEADIGVLAWMLTDGHHRTLSAIAAELPHLEVKLDYSTITSDEDLKSFKSEG